LKRKPDRATVFNANTVNQETCHISCPGSFLCLVKKYSNAAYHVNVAQSTCTCKYYQKKGYCKHVLLSLYQCNLDSRVIEVKPMLKYKGNTKRKKKCKDLQKMHCLHVCIQE